MSSTRMHSSSCRHLEFDRENSSYIFASVGHNIIDSYEMISKCDGCC